MVKITHLVRVVGEGCDRKIHLPGVQGYATVCGWCDVDTRRLDWPRHQVNCEACLDMVRKIRDMRMPDGSLP